MAAANDTATRLAEHGDGAPIHPQVRSGRSRMILERAYHARPIGPVLATFNGNAPVQQRTDWLPAEPAPEDSEEATQ